MKRKSFFLWSLLAAALTVTSCSDSESPIDNGGGEDGPKGGVKFEVTFNKEAGVQTRAANRPIPVTTWEDIHTLQFLFYDASGVIKTAKSITPSEMGTGKTVVYTDIPVGTYTVVALANVSNTTKANGDYDPQSWFTWDSYIYESSTTPAAWGDFGVRQKKITDLILKNRVGKFEDFADPENGNVAYIEPNEVFMAYATDVKVEEGSNVYPKPFQLKREVSMMRVILNTAMGENTNNKQFDASNPNGVDYTKNSSILVYRLPENMKIGEGVDGGASASSNTKSVLSIASKTSSVFYDENPTTGYAPDNNILDKTAGYTLWRSLVVAPNNGGNRGNVSGEAKDAQKYFIVVSALGKEGHESDSGTLDDDTTLYWYGTIQGNFNPNVIREVKLNLMTGGSTTIPPGPSITGNLEIELGAPLQWSDEVDIEEMEL